MTTSTTFTEINLAGYVNANIAYNPATFPTGTTTGNEGLGIPFTIASLNGKAGMWSPDYLPGHSVGGNVAGTSLTVNLLPYNLSGQDSFYALLNNYWGTTGANEYNITITATNGDTYTYSSIGGTNTRDYNQNAVNTIAETTTNWFNNGIGQRLDAREFQLPSNFSNDTLASLTINQLNGTDAVMFSGLTFSNQAPESFQVVLQPVTISVAMNQTATPLGIAAPYDAGFANSALTIKVTSLPTDGTITLADGVTAVTAGESLTVAQLEGLAFTPTAGAHNQTSTFTYTVTDPNGDSAIGTASLGIGNVPIPATPAAPTITQENTNGYANTGALTIQGTAAAGSTVTIYDGTTIIGTTTANATTGAYSATLTTALANGAHSISVAANFAAGGTSPDSVATAVTVDTATPTVAITSNAGTVTHATQTISGTVTGDAGAIGSTVSIYDNGSSTAIGTATVGADGTWSAQVSLADNVNSLVAKDTNLAGTTGTSSAVVDTLLPATPAAPTIVQENANGYADTGALTIQGTAAAGSTVAIYDGSTQIGTTIATASGTYSDTLSTPLADGSHSINVTDTFADGGTSAVSTATAVSVGTSAPVVIQAATPTVQGSGSVVLGTAASGYNGTATLTGHYTADNASFVYLSSSNATLGTLIGSTTAWQQSYALPTTALTPGATNYLHVESINYGGPGGLVGTFTLSGTNAAFANTGTQTMSTGASGWSSVLQSTNSAVAQQPWMTPTNAVDTEGANGVGPWGNVANVASTAQWINDPTTGAASQGQGYNSGYYTVDFSAPINIIGTGASADPLSIALVSDQKFATGSSVSLVGGNVVYTPGGVITAALAGSDTITYTVTDTLTGAATTQTEVVKLVDPTPTVTLATAPSADNATKATLGTAAPGTAGDALRVALTSDADFASGSSISLVGGNLVYTPGVVTKADIGNDTISYTVTDTVTGAFVTETQNVALNDTPNPVVTLAASPTANNDVQATLGTAVAGVNHDALTVALTGDADFASGSSVSLAADGTTIVYTPGTVTAADIGADAITVTVTDSVTGAVTTEHLTVALRDGAGPIGQGGNDVVNLDGYGNVVQGPASAAASNGNAGAAITGVPNGYQTLTGTAASETINGWGYGNTIIGNGGDDTINAGTGFANVSVSDANGNNVVRGADGNSTVTLGNGNNTINVGGYSNVITLGSGDNKVNAGTGLETVTLGAGTDEVIAQGYGDVFNLAGGNVTLSGMQGDVTINLASTFNASSSVDIAEMAGNSFSFNNNVGEITGLNGAVFATINAVAGATLVGSSDGKGGIDITLSSYVPVAAPAPIFTAEPTTPVVPATQTITETQSGADLALTNATQTVHLFGYNNIVTGGNGSWSIDGDKGSLNAILGNGNSVLVLSGYNDEISLGAGNSSISGTSGSATITTGAGNQTINASGYYNVITTGAGNSTINAGDGNAVVTVGTGNNSIIAGGNDNIITTGLGNNSLTLSGWGNYVDAGAGATSVSGGYANTYNVTAIGNAGGLSIADFNATYGDVLNVSDVVSSISQLSAAIVGNDLLISTTIGATTSVIANLHGLSGTSLNTMIAAHSLVV